MPRETFQQKAARLVAAGRVSLCGPFAIVIGDHGTYELSWEEMEWQCPCGSRRRRCSHVLAVELVRAQRVETERHEREREIEQEEQPMSAQQPQAAPFQIRKAEKRQLKARIALLGPPGCGKTYSALGIAQGLTEGGRAVLVDTEHRTSEKFAQDFDFDVLVLDPETVAYNTYSPATYTAVIKHCIAQGYAVIIIDSLSHAWMGKDGALEQVDKKTKGGGNSFTAWGDVTPLQREMVETILGAPCHVIATMRTKVEYLTDTVNNKMTISKVGTKPVQRDDVEYEFDVIGEFDQLHNMRVTKTRLSFLDGACLARPGKQLGLDILADLNSDATPTSSTDGSEASAEAAAPAWQWDPKMRGKAGVKMARLGIAPEAAETKLAAVTSQKMMDLLSKELTTEDKRQKAAGTVGVWAPAGEEQPPAAEPVAAAPEATGVPATAPAAPPPTPAETPPVEAPTVAPPTPAAPAEPEGDEAVSDDPFAEGAGEGEEGAEEGGIGTSLFGNSADVAALLESATKMVKADAVPPGLMMAAANSEVLQALIAADLGISAADQEALLMELGRGSWEELKKPERLALYWMAQERAEKRE